MMNARSVLTGLIVSAAALLASCGKGVVSYTVGGNISGATTTVLITLNGTTGINMSGDGNFKFPSQLMTGDTYNVQIADPNDRCTVANGAGTVAMINIANLSITCVAQPANRPVVRSARLSGAAESPAVMTNASGSGGAIVNSSTLVITGGVTFSGLTAVNSVGLFQAPSMNPAGSGPLLVNLTVAADGVTARSEEHTSELQSRRDLVCRLLLEKKKKTIQTITKYPSTNTTTILPRVYRDAHNSKQTE